VYINSVYAIMLIIFVSCLFILLDPVFSFRKLHPDSDPSQFSVNRKPRTVKHVLGDSHIFDYEILDPHDEPKINYWTTLALSNASGLEDTYKVVPVKGPTFSKHVVLTREQFDILDTHVTASFFSERGLNAERDGNRTIASCHTIGAWILSRKGPCAKLLQLTQARSCDADDCSSDVFLQRINCTASNSEKDMKPRCQVAGRRRVFDSKPVTLVIPFSFEDLPEVRRKALFTFLDYIGKLTNTDAHIFAIFVVPRTEVAEVSRICLEKTKLYGKHRVSVIQYRSPPSSKIAFSRSIGLRDGILHSVEGGIVMLVDVDIEIGHEAVTKCRALVSPSSAYFPVVFMRYPELPSRRRKSLSNIGYWASMGFGMSCMLKSSFISAGGFGGDEERKFNGWGNEDNVLRTQILKTGISVFRAPDFSFTHNWHPKICREEESNFAACLTTLKRSLGVKI
jgi:hypothetical protein